VLDFGLVKAAGTPPKMRKLTQANVNRGARLTTFLQKAVGEPGGKVTTKSDLYANWRLSATFLLTATPVIRRQKRSWTICMKARSSLFRIPSPSDWAAMSAPRLESLDPSLPCLKLPLIVREVPAAIMEEFSAMPNHCIPGHEKTPTGGGKAFRMTSQTSSSFHRKTLSGGRYARNHEGELKIDWFLGAPRISPAIVIRKPDIGFRCWNWGCWFIIQYGLACICHLPCPKAPSNS